MTSLIGEWRIPQGEHNPKGIRDAYVDECLHKILSSLRKARAKGYQFGSLCMIFDVRVDLWGKYRLLIEVHVVD